MNTMRTILFLILTATTGAVAANDRVMLVLDVSGSMWGQIAGVTKIEIAREALGELVDGWEDGRDVGLIAYGHREKGNCNDIEEVVPVGPLQPEKMKKVVQGLVPKGRTPLSAAVKLAAESLKFSEDKATVILISDGKETCNLDPCDVGSELESLGVDFTAHVIGFDVKKIEDQQGLRCLAENTGGRFISADNAAELNQALEQTVTVVEPEPAPEGSLDAPEEVVKGTGFSVLPHSTELGLGGYVYLYRVGANRAAAYAYVRGEGPDYEPADIRMPAVAGEYELRWLLKDSQLVATRPIRAVEPDIVFIAPERAIAGTEIEMEIDAPLGLGGYVYLYAEGRDKSLGYAYVREGKLKNYDNVRLRLPAQPGNYELKWLSNDNQVYASAVIVAELAELAINVPTEAAAGTEFPIDIAAPDGLTGYLYLYAAGRDKSLAYAYVREAAGGGYQQAKLRLPAAPGEYEVKWISNKKEELATALINAVAVEAVLEAPQHAQAGTEIGVTPQGPMGLSGYIYLYAAGRDKHIAYAYVREDNHGDYQRAALKLPAMPGDYNIKWVSPNKEVIAESPLLIEEVQVSLDFPANAAMGTEISIGVNAPDGMSGQIKLFAEGRKKHLAYGYVREANSGGYQPVKMRLPANPGDFVLRWFSGRGEVITEAPITIEQADVSLVAPESATIASEIEIRFEAPPGLKGQVQLFKPGKKKHLAYAYVREGKIEDYDPSRLVVAGQPGDYVLRWRSSRGEVLAEAPISLEPVNITIDAPPAVPVSELFEIRMDAPEGIRGRMELVSGATGKAVTSRNVVEGNVENYAPVRLKSPPKPGDYSLRWTARDKTVLAEQAITVVSEDE